jgi:hypothetical protein
MSSSVSGRGGFSTIYLKHYEVVRAGNRYIAASTYVQTLVELLLLLVYYAEAEVNLVGLFKCRLHSHDLRKSLFSMLERSIAIVEDSDAVPELRFLDTVRERYMGDS